MTERLSESQIPLAIVIVRAGSSEIVPTDIIDVRCSMDVVGGMKKGYMNFDNNLGGVWEKYISIPVLTPPSESVQYRIEIDGDEIRVYSNDLKDVLVRGHGMNDFWSSIQHSGSDIRVFDENCYQNYFWVEEFDYDNRKVWIWVNLNAGQRELNIAYGNEKCVMSSYNNKDRVFGGFIDDLVACWQFEKVENGVVYDTSGYNNHGELHGCTIVDGYCGCALNFDGEDYIYVEANRSPLDVGSDLLTDFTVVIRFRTSIGGMLYHVNGKGNDRNIWISGGDIYCRIWNLEVISSKNQNYNDDNWHVVCHWVKQGVGQRAFVDCIEVASGSKDKSDFDWATNINIGGGVYGIAPSYRGMIDEVLIFKRPLDIEEMQYFCTRYGIGGRDGRFCVRKRLESDLCFDIPTIKMFK